MAKPKVFIWPVPDTQAICLLQTLGGAGTLVLNGHLTVNVQSPGNAIFPGITRTVSLTSANNLSARNFTIIGYLNGSIISEVIAGPNANTVETTAIFDQVTSVTVNGAAADISIGSGTTGRTHWENCNYNIALGSTTYQVVIGGTIDWTINATCDDVGTNTSPFLTVVATNTTSLLVSQITPPVIYSSLFVNSSGSDGSLVLTYIEGGIL